MNMKKIKSVEIWFGLMVAVLVWGSGYGQAQAADSHSSSAADAYTQAILTASAQVRETVYDNYFTYFTADELRLMMDDYQGSFGGVGITMLVNDKEQVLISGVYQDGPAAAAGVLPGDIILAVDGVSLGKVADANVAALKIRGEISTEVTLTLQRETVGNIDLTMVRDTVSAVSVKGELLPQLPGLAYIRISDFAENTADEFMEEYNRLLEDGAIKALIFDLRSNTGGSFYAALRIANYFIVNNGLIVTEKMGDKEQPYLSSSGVLANLPIVVLQNGYTASASEVLAGAIADYGHTVLVGSNSYGKGITQSLEPLPSGNGLRYTRGKYLTPSGFSLHGSGLKPDILVEDPPDATAQSYFSLDPSQNTHLAAAIEYLQKNVYN